jgi:probable HAF family extracellular repeat protein
MLIRNAHKLSAAIGAAVLVSGLLFTGSVAAETPDRDAAALRGISFPTDPRFTQLLGINDHGVIAGYHGDENTEMTPNQGFTLQIVDNQNQFTNENFPNSVQTQVIGIDNAGDTVGFYIDTAGATHGFFKAKDKDAVTVDLPGTTFNQLLGINNKGQDAGYFQDAAGLQHAYVRQKDGSFLVLSLPQPSSQATGVNDKGTVVGFMQTSPQDTKSTGYILKNGKLTELQAPGSTFTQALGVNNSDDVVGFYNDANGVTHGFVYDNGNWETVNGPNAVSTVINGINNHDALVGFYMDQNNNTIGLLGSRKS